jgi:glucosamine--fructose-6-phosphate aminotransferase (isomerizing)
LSAPASEADEYDLNSFGVVGLSNSGRTNELVRLFAHLRSEGHDTVVGVTAGSLDGPLSAVSQLLHQIECGPEEAVAATKSVVNQALFLDAIDANLHKRLLPDLHHLGNLFQQVLEMSLVEEVIRLFEQASTIFFAGRSNGVGEELALKTNEITRKKSAFLPGTYALHGIEEVMDGSEVLLLVDPFVEDEHKFQKVIADGVGIPVVALSTRQTIFPTIRIPYGGLMHPYLELAAGWNLLVETGLRLRINIDKGLRARKIGNEVSINTAQ